MKTPLIRQGEGNTGLERIYEQRAEDTRRIDRMIRTATSNPDLQAQRGRIIGARSAEGDQHRLRGIPCVAEGVTGTSPGTDPLLNVLSRERAS